MKIEYFERKQVDLTDEQVLQVTKAQLMRLVYPGEYLRYDGKKGKAVLKQDDPNWRHGSVSEEYIRDATELDLAVFRVLEALRK